MNTADIPGLIVALPIVAIEARYWGVSFERRGPWAKRVEAWLLILLLVFIAFRLFTVWGVVKF